MKKIGRIAKIVVICLVILFFPSGIVGCHHALTGSPSEGVVNKVALCEDAIDLYVQVRRAMIIAEMLAEPGDLDRYKPYLRAAEMAINLYCGSDVAVFYPGLGNVKDDPDAFDPGLAPNLTPDRASDADRIVVPR